MTGTDSGANLDWCAIRKFQGGEFGLSGFGVVRDQVNHVADVCVIIDEDAICRTGQTFDGELALFVGEDVLDVTMIFHLTLK